MCAKGIRYNVGRYRCAKVVGNFILSRKIRIQKICETGGFILLAETFLHWRRGQMTAINLGISFYCIRFHYSLLQIPCSHGLLRESGTKGMSCCRRRHRMNSNLCAITWTTGLGFATSLVYYLDYCILTKESLFIPIWQLCLS